MPTTSRRRARSRAVPPVVVPTDWHALLRGGLVAVLVLVVSFFPHTSATVAKAMRWWWFRLACLLLLVWCVVTGTVSPLVGVLLATVYVCAANAQNVRAARGAT